MAATWIAPLVAWILALAVLLLIGAAIERSRQRLAQERQALVVVATSARRLARTPR